jgi:outer membrane protein OmpA-like peptidoglycan-associated protein/tetratricopeptide (TPR) repeat protein
MRKFTTTTLVLAAIFLFSGTLFSQKAEKVNRKTALRHFENGNWEKSKQMYLELLKTDPEDEELNLYCGISYLNSRHEGEKSLDHFNKINERDIPAVLLFKAEAYHYVGKFDSAKIFYEKYRDLDGNKVDKELSAEMDTRIEQCNTGIEFMKTPVEGLFVENLGEDVNTIFIDYAPVVYEDLKTLAFTGTTTNLYTIKYMTYQEAGEEEIFYTNYDPVYKKWLPRAKADGVVLNQSIDSEGNESSITWSSDLARFYFYRDGALWVSDNLGDPVKTDISSGGFTDKQIISIVINRAEDAVFIVSDKKGGQGGSDIYMSVKGSDGKWGSYENLNINTEADETSPYISGDGNKLYFASNGYNSMGGYDIFVATKADSGFANVRNMGLPVNSSANDMHFRLTGGNEEFGYLASDRIGGQGDYDIWRFWTCFDISTTNLNGDLVAKNGAIGNLSLTLMTSDSAIVGTTSSIGAYSFGVNTETDYILKLDVEGNAIQYFNISTPELCKQYDIYQLLEVELNSDADNFVYEQRSSLTNAFYDINGVKDDKSSKEYVQGLTSSDPTYTDPDIQVTTFEKDAMIANLGKDPITNADGKEVYESLFDFNKATLSDEDQAFAKNLGTSMKNNPNMKIVIAGHTDSQGPAGYNKRLSKRRADAVSDILVQQGASQNQITIEAYGETQLKVKDTDENGGFIIRNGKQNRRVEIEIQ